MALVVLCLVLSSCGRPATPAARPPVTTNHNDAAVTRSSTRVVQQRQSNCIQSSSHLERVEGTLGRFDDMLALMTDAANDSTYFRTNSIDVALFVRGKTEEDIWQVANSAKMTMPFVAKQLLEYLLETSSSLTMLEYAAGLYADNLMLVGGPDDQPRVKVACAKIAHALQATPAEDRPAYLERSLAVLNKHATIFDDDELRSKLAQLAQAYSESPIGATLADYYTAQQIMLSSGDAAPAKARLLAIKKRNAYGAIDATEDDIDTMLDTFDTHVATLRKFREQNPQRKPALGYALKFLNMSPEQIRELTTPR